MADRWAMIKNGVVDNVCLWDGLLTTWQPPEGYDMVKAPDHIGIGWLYDGTTEVWSQPPPPPEVPADPVI